MHCCSIHCSFLPKQQRMSDCWFWQQLIGEGTWAMAFQGSILRLSLQWPSSRSLSIGKMKVRLPERGLNCRRSRQLQAPASFVICSARFLGEWCWSFQVWTIVVGLAGIYLVRSYWYQDRRCHRCPTFWFQGQSSWTEHHWRSGICFSISCLSHELTSYPQFVDQVLLLKVLLLL